MYFCVSLPFEYKAERTGPHLAGSPQHFGA